MSSNIESKSYQLSNIEWKQTSTSYQLVQSLVLFQKQLHAHFLHFEMKFEQVFYISVIFKRNALKILSSYLNKFEQNSEPNVKLTKKLWKSIKLRSSFFNFKTNWHICSFIIKWLSELLGLYFYSTWLRNYLCTRKRVFKQQPLSPWIFFVHVEFKILVGWTVKSTVLSSFHLSTLFLTFS